MSCEFISIDKWMDNHWLGLKSLMLGRKGPFTDSACSQYFFISGTELKRLRCSWRKVSLAKKAGQTYSIQQVISARKKSTYVRQPTSHSLLPLNLASWAILGLIFSKLVSFADQPLAAMSALNKLSHTSLRTPSIFSTVALSFRSFPKSSFLFDLSTMQMLIALDSVIFTSLSMRQGMLGKSRPKLSLSPPNHCAGLVYLTFSQTAPVQASSSLATWALPLMPQYPKVVFPQLIQSF